MLTLPAFELSEVTDERDAFASGAPNAVADADVFIVVNGGAEGASKEDSLRLRFHDDVALSVISNNIFTKLSIHS